MSLVVFINPPTSTFEHLPAKKHREYVPYPPLGILYMAAVLEKEGYTVKVYDMMLPDNRELPRSIVEEAALVGITVCTPGYLYAREAADSVKALAPDTPVVMGGPHVTFTAEETLTDGNVDIVVRGEGEETILELAQCITTQGDLKKVKGITYIDGTIKSTPDRPFIKNLDALPFPARHHVDLDSYELGAHLITGRGCPHRCLFCAAGPLSGYTYRVRSPENVLEEITECYHLFDVEHFLFADDTFTAIPERTAAICRLIKDTGEPITWTCECRANNVTPGLLKTMAESGCIRVQFGVESGSDFILRSIRKGTTTSMVKKAVQWSLDAGIEVLCSFIIGHPEDTAETVEQTIAFSEELMDMGGRKHVTVGFAVATPFPGTELYERAGELGVKIHKRDWSAHNFLEPIIDTKHLRRQQLQNYLFQAMLEESKNILQIEEGTS